MQSETLLATLTETLQELIEKQNESDSEIGACRTATERAQATAESATKDLDRAVFEEGRARQAHRELLAHITGLSDAVPKCLNQKLADLTTRISSADEAVRAARKRATECNNALDAHRRELVFAQDRHGRILQERTALATQINRLN